MRPGQLLAGGDRSFLQQVLEEALAAPADDRTAAQLAAEALIALAGEGADDAVAGHLLGPAVDYEVRVLAIGEPTPRESVAGLAAADAVRCFAAADAGREDGLTVELLATERGEERVLLVRRGTEVPRLVLRDERRAATIAARRRVIGTDQGDPVAVLAEVLAHLPTPEDIVEAVRSALSEMTVEVDADSIRRVADDGVAAVPGHELVDTIAVAVRDRLGESGVLPTADDIAGAVRTRLGEAGLLPTAEGIAELVRGRTAPLLEEGVGEQLETTAQAWALLDRRFDEAGAAAQERAAAVQDGFEAQLQAVARVWGALDGRLQEQDTHASERAAAVEARLDRHDEVAVELGVALEARLDRHDQQATEQSAALSAHLVALGRLVAQHTSSVDRQLLAEARVSARHRAGVEDRLAELRTALEGAVAAAAASADAGAERRDGQLAAEHRWLRERLDELQGSLRSELEHSSAARDAELTEMAARLVELEADRADLHDKVDRVQGALRRIIG